MQKTKTQTGRYEAQRFLEELKNPCFAELSRPKGNFNIRISLFAEGKGFYAEKESKALDQMLVLASKNVEDINVKFWQSETFRKVAMFFAIEEKAKEK